jgi:hypothetical protein
MTASYAVSGNLGLTDRFSRRIGLLAGSDAYVAHTQQRTCHAYEAGESTAPPHVGSDDAVDRDAEGGPDGRAEAEHGLHGAVVPMFTASR